MKSQDVIYALVVHLVPRAWTYPSISDFSGLSASQSHMSCKRLREARLLRQEPGEPWLVSAANLTEFLTYGVPYVFPVTIGEPTWGIPTAYAAPFVQEGFVPGKYDPVVWPTADGKVQGNALDPLHACQLTCIDKPGGDSIYRALVCIDLLRMGQSRERAWAKDTLAEALRHAKS